MHKYHTPLSQQELQQLETLKYIASQKHPRYIKCPYCGHKSIVIFDDTRGFVQAKCYICRNETVFDTDTAVCYSLKS